MFTICAAFQVAGWTIGAVERTKRQLIPGPVEKLTVDAGRRRDPGPARRADGKVRVDTSTKGSLHSPRVRAIKDGAHLLLSGNCPEFSFGPCRAEIVLHVPVSTAVVVRSSSGDITASGVGGRSSSTPPRAT